MNIRGFLASSFNEWENRVAAVIFVGGCNWRCAYCHGARLVNDFQQLPEISPRQILATLRERRAWLDGVVITGGEPTLQADLQDFMRELHAEKFPLKLSTNAAQPAVIEKLLNDNLLTCLSYDYKTTLDGRLAGLAKIPRAEVEAVKHALQIMRTANLAEKEVHTTLCPAFITPEILATMAEQLKIPEALWILQPYIAEVAMLDAKTAGLASFTETELSALKTTVEQYHPRVLLHTGKRATANKINKQV